MLELYGFALNEHEILTIWRHFDSNNDGHISFPEFYQALEKEHYNMKSQVHSYFFYSHKTRLKFEK